MYLIEYKDFETEYDNIMICETLEQAKTKLEEFRKDDLSEVEAQQRLRLIEDVDYKPKGFICGYTREYLKEPWWDWEEPYWSFNKSYAIRKVDFNTWLENDYEDLED